MEPDKSVICLVITSIAGTDNPVLQQWAAAAAQQGAQFILIGDKKSPEMALSGCDTWSLARQLDESGLSFARLAPVNHYARKNMGYLLAARAGATVLFETDDDNIPYDSFWNEHRFQSTGRSAEGRGWMNVYRYFTDQTIWPRGFPLENVKSTPAVVRETAEARFCPIQQGLVDENPDVDAIYRLTMPLPLSFEDHPPLLLSEGQWCPFNSQNTVWHPSAFPLLYLPTHCSFRMTDIWRSFVAQRVAWAFGWNVSFYKATVWQQRNEHNLMRDFEQEIPGYMSNTAMCTELEALKLSADPGEIFTNLYRCYERLVEKGWLPAEELPLLRAWITDFEAMGFSITPNP